MKSILLATLLVGMAACGTNNNFSSVKSYSMSVKSICGVSEVDYKKLDFELRDLVKNADTEELSNTTYRFALKTVGSLDTVLAMDLKTVSGAIQINEIAGSIGTGRGSLCSIVKLANDDRVEVVQNAKRL